MLNLILNPNDKLSRPERGSLKFTDEKLLSGLCGTYPVKELYQR